MDTLSFLDPVVIFLHEQGLFDWRGAIMFGVLVGCIVVLLCSFIKERG